MPSLKVTTPLQTFSLFVTAEPYPAVRQPSEMLIVENDVRESTKGKLFIVENYPLMKRSQYQKLANPLALTVDLKQAPLELYQARNAVDIARTRGAAKYAPEIFSKAEGGLDMAEKALSRKAKSTEIISLSRTATQASEDARALTAERVEAERIAGERAAAAAAAKSAAEAKAAAEAAAAKERADREAKLQAELAASREAQLKAEAAAKLAAANARHGQRSQRQGRSRAGARGGRDAARAAARTVQPHSRDQGQPARPGHHDGRRAVRHREVQTCARPRVRRSRGSPVSSWGTRG